MRIQSHFHDYYDTLLKQGFESDRFFLRKTYEWDHQQRIHAQAQTENTPPEPEVLRQLAKDIPRQIAYMHSKHTPRAMSLTTHLSALERITPKNERLVLEPLLYVVAGKVIPAVWIRLEKFDPNRVFYQDSLQVVPLNEQGEMDAYAREARRSSNREPDKEGKLEYKKNDPVFQWSAINDALPEEWQTIFQENKNHYNMVALRQWFETMLQKQDQYYTALSDSNVLVAVITSRSTVQNPQLQQYKFPRYWDAHTCMQELSMFIGNMAAPDRVPVTIEDQYRIAQHGFDERSFRKQPTKTAQPRRQKRPHPDRPASVTTEPVKDDTAAYGADTSMGMD